MNYWLMKTEPDTFGLADLEKAPKKTTTWDGVRNYQARNMLRDQMKKGDQAFLYHSSCEVPGIVAVMEVVREGHPDPSALDRKHKYYDPDSDPKSPRWFSVDVKLRKKLGRTITLDELRAHEKQALEGSWLLRKGNRLSIVPVDARHWRFIVELE